MDIGVIGAGNMGSGLGKIWAGTGHRIMFSFARDPRKLEELVRSVGAGASAGSPADAAQFGEVVLLTVPWGAIEEAVRRTEGKLGGKVVISCNNPLKPDLSGLALGTVTSGAEEVARLAAGARVVEALFPFAEALHSGSVAIGAERPTQFYCGDDAAAKALVAQLIRDVGLEPVDAGPLTNARYLEPLGMLLVQLAYFQGMGTTIGIRILRS